MVLEGTDVTQSYATISQQDGSPGVILKLSEAGRTKFSEATGRLKGQKISIYMDENEISAPTVNEQITTDTAEIYHIGSLDEAKALSDKINSGSLPFSLIVKNCNIISQLSAAARCLS